jgi:Tfp pilus assembly protein PilF
VTRRGLLLVVVLLAVAGAALLGGRWLRARSERQQALQLAGLGRFAEARPLLEGALARDPGDAVVLKQLALGTMEQDADAAEGYLTRWCELRPGDAEPFHLRMALRQAFARDEREMAEKLRLMGLALADGQRVLELDPDLDEVRRQVAWLLLGVGRFAEAEQACRRCLARAPGDLALFYLLARARHGQGDRARAEALLDAVVRGQPGFPEALLFRAVLHREANQPDRAVALLRQALALKDCPRRDCLYELSLALASAGQADEAGRVMAELRLLTLQDHLSIENLPHTPSVRVQLAEAMLAAGKAEEAKAQLDRALADVPDFAPAHLALARYYEHKGQPDRAAEHRKKAGDTGK